MDIQYIEETDDDASCNSETTQEASSYSLPISPPQKALSVMRSLGVDILLKQEKSHRPFTHDLAKRNSLLELMHGVDMLTQSSENVFKSIDMPTITQAEAISRQIPSSSLQTILFNRHYWTVPQAKAWLHEHKHKRGTYRRTANETRFMQVNPIQNASFYAKKLPNHITLIFQEY